MKLIGYINPSAKLPASVIPVWYDESQYYGVFSERNDKGDVSRKLYLLDKESKISLLPDGWKDVSIQGCDKEEVCFLALSPQKIIAYPISNEEELVSSLLDDPSFAIDKPFTRYALAKLTQKTYLLVTELLSCASYLLSQEVLFSNSSGKERIERWLSEQESSLLQHYNISSEIKAMISDLPKKVEDISSMSWWRKYTSIQPSVKKCTLNEIERISPSPKTIAILNIEPTVPDKEILDLMAEHIIAGTNYLFFHAPNANQVVLKNLKNATDEAVKYAKNKLTSSLSRFHPPAVGCIEYFVLESPWTGSPYVFYEIAANDETKVTGYRGLDIGSSISQFYEKLPDGFASELLEALTSPLPKKQKLDDVNYDSVIDLEKIQERKKG